MKTLSKNRYSNHSSSYKGVSYHSGTGKWISRYYKKGKQVWLGSFKTEQAAAAAYSSATGLVFVSKNRYGKSKKKAGSSISAMTTANQSCCGGSCKVDLSKIDLSVPIEEMSVVHENPIMDLAQVLYNLLDAFNSVKEALENAEKTVSFVEPTTEEIQERAYQVYIQRGFPAGQDQDWHEALRQLRAEKNPSFTG